MNRSVVAGPLALALLLAGCSSAEDEPTASPSPVGQADAVEAPDTGADAAPGQEDEEPEDLRIDQADHVTWAATATVPEVEVRDAPDGEVTHTFEHPNHNGVPLTFMVVDEQDGWLEVQLPVRPNGSTGWVAADDVDLAGVPYRLEVSVADKELVVLRSGHELYRFPVATGTGDTPTPTGTYYLTELLQPTNPGYGPYAYGLSAFSDVLNEFGGGPGQIGLHGTDDEGTIGQDVSAGCIRLANADITALTRLLPLGTPIVIS